MLSSVPGLSSTVSLWAGNDPFLNSTRCLPGLRGIDRNGGLTPCLVPSTKTSVQGRATILSVASRIGAGTVAASSGSFDLGGGATSFALSAASLSFALAVCNGSRALGAALASLALRSVFGSPACGGAFGSCARGGADSGVSTAIGPTLGAAVGGATDATAFASPSESRWLRAMTPVPTISVNASGAATSNLLLTACTPGQLCRLSFGNLRRRRFGRRRVGLGAGTGTVRRRLLGAE